MHEVVHEQTRVNVPEQKLAPEPEPEPEPEQKSEPASEAEPQPVPLLDSRTPDDLQRIEGIGPKMAGALHAAGITTYAQLGASDEATIRAAITAARLRFAPSLPTWPRQARLLADGDESGFTDLTRRLIGGRDTGRG